jgi:hypothetical protein
MHVHPHLVGPTGIRVRNGLMIDHHFAWSDIEEVRLFRQTVGGSRTIQLDENQKTQFGTQPGETGPDAAMLVTVSSQTNVEIVLQRPRSFGIPKVGQRNIRRIRFFADDPVALLSAVRSVVADLPDEEPADGVPERAADLLPAEEGIADEHSGKE